jgi:ABC-2 type transport system ATP-binding protein
MIKTERLSKRYDTLTAVDDVSFEVHPGEVLGFLGPNGAGKTTTMRMLAGFISPTSGTASICGHDITTDTLAAKRSIGYLPEGAPLYGEMTVLELPRIHRRPACALRRAHTRAASNTSSGGCSLRRCSSRRSRRCRRDFAAASGLAQALLPDPPVLILDEPTDGLDPNQKHEVRALINEMSQGKIIIISTHLLEEVDAVCTRAIIIARGRIVADDTPQGLAARSRYHNAVSLQLDGTQDLLAARDAIAALPLVESVEMSERDARITALPRAGAQILPSLSELAARRGLNLKELHLESGRLDEVFRTITA